MLQRPTHYARPRAHFTPCACLRRMRSACSMPCPSRWLRAEFVALMPYTAMAGDAAPLFRPSYYLSNTCVIQLTSPRLQGGSKGLC